MRKSIIPVTTIAGTAFSLLILATVTLLIYSNTFHAPFVYDDGINITNNPRIRITELSWTGIVDVLKNRSVNSANRPFAALTIALNYYFHQYQVAGYHVVNLLIHIIAAFCVYLLTRQTLILCKTEPSYIPLLAALLWMANPLHTQSVTYIVQRMNSMAAMFYLLAMICYIQARRLQLSAFPATGSINGSKTTESTSDPNSRWIKVALYSMFVVSAASAFLALTSKENSVTLPILIFLYEWYFFQRLDRAWLKKKIKWLGGGAVLIIIIVLIYLDADPVQKILSTYKQKPFTPAQRVLSQPSVIIYYISLIVFPYPGRLHLIYDFPLSAPMLTGLSITALMALIFFAVYAARRQRLISFTIFWFLGTLAIESSIIGMAVIYEHRTYLPSVFPFIAGAWWALRHVRPRAIAVAAIVSVVVVSGVWTFQRNHVWEDEIRFWQDAVAKTPFDVDCINSLGLAFKDAGDYQQALFSFERASRLGKKELYEFTAANIGTVLIESGRFEAAVPYLERVVAGNTMNKDTDGSLNLRLPDDVFSAYRVRNLYKKAYLNLGIALQQTGHPAEAIQNYRYALGVDPQIVSAWNNMGNAFFSQGDIEKAMMCFKNALAVDPAYEQAAVNLKKIEAIMNQYGPVIERMEADTGRQPQNALLSYQLGTVYQATGMIDKAIRQYNKTLALDPEMAQCLNSLAGLYVNTRQLQKAAELMEKMSALMPENPTVFYNLACLYARQKMVDRAVTALKTAVDKGYDRWSHIRSDEDLANIRDTSYYRELMSVNRQ